MGNNSKLRNCRYVNCKHNNKIDLEKEPYQKDLYGYYHEDCFKEKCDLQLFRDLWKKYISNTVVIKQLNNVINDLLNRGVTSDYLLFVLEYIIENKKELRYPAGFRYYVDNSYIKDDYKKRKTPKIKQDVFVAKNVDDNAPQFSIRNKEQGFQSILKKGDAH